MMGSRSSSILSTGGSLAGLSTLMISPSVVVTSYTTVGAEVIRSMSYSRSRRSCTISMCSRPRKPHAEAEAQRAGNFGLVVQRRIVQAQLGQRVAEFS